MFPPAEAPPRMSPAVGVALSSALCLMDQRSASQQSFTPTGNLCSGANLIRSVSPLVL
jgi:hypothetical protein